MPSKAQNSTLRAVHVFSYSPTITQNEVVSTATKIRPLDLRHWYTEHTGQGSTMVTMSDTATQPLDTSTPNTQTMNYCDSTPKLSSDYEKCREQRIKENLERLQKLGIHDLSLKLKSMKPNTNRRNNKPYKTPNRCISPFPSSVPSRRSSRFASFFFSIITSIVV